MWIFIWRWWWWWSQLSTSSVFGWHAAIVDLSILITYITGRLLPERLFDGLTPDLSSSSTITTINLHLFWTICLSAKHPVRPGRFSGSLGNKMGNLLNSYSPRTCGAGLRLSKMPSTPAKIIEICDSFKKLLWFNHPFSLILVADYSVLIISSITSLAPQFSQPACLKNQDGVDGLLNRTVI